MSRIDQRHHRVCTYEVTRSGDQVTACDIPETCCMVRMNEDTGSNVDQPGVTVWLAIEYGFQYWRWNPGTDLDTATAWYRENIARRRYPPDASYPERDSLGPRRSWRTAVVHNILLGTATELSPCEYDVGVRHMAPWHEVQKSYYSNQQHMPRPEDITTVAMALRAGSATRRFGDLEEFELIELRLSISPPRNNVVRAHVHDYESTWIECADRTRMTSPSSTCSKEDTHLHYTVRRRHW